MTVNVHLSGEGIEFEREVSEAAALQIMELSMSNGATAGEAQEDSKEQEEEQSMEVEDDETSLPDSFFNRLSAKQEALLGVLNNADEPISSNELQRRMEDEFDESVGGGRGVAGILQGFTKKYGDDFKVVKIDWGDHQGYYQLNPDRPDYIKEIKEYFND